jgi:site-specific recombinase XerD
VAEWPSADRVAWEHAQRPGDFLEPGGVAVQWVAESRRHIEKGYGAWLMWLDTDGELDPGSSPASRVTRDRVRRYIDYLDSTMSPFSVQARVQQLGNAMRAMAEGQDWKWITRAAGRIRSRAASVRNKRAHLQSPDRLLELGIGVMEAIEDAPTVRPGDAATRYRNGLIIALLALRPMRSRNLLMIRTNEHLVRTGDSYRVVFAAHETKNGRPLEFSWPEDLVPYLERYLGHYRPVLLRGKNRDASASDMLWITRDGTALDRQTLHHHVTRTTKLAFGMHINPHLIRDCVATMMAILNPEHARDIAPILGHATLTTSENYYNQAKGLDASRRYHLTLHNLRTKAKANASGTEGLSKQKNSKRTSSEPRRREVVIESSRYDSQQELLLDSASAAPRPVA